MQDECRKWVWQLSSRDRAVMHACIHTLHTLYDCYAHETRGVFLALGCELRYNTADRARAKARSRSRSYAAMYTVYDVGFVRITRLNTLSALTYTCSHLVIESKYHLPPLSTTWMKHKRREDYKPSGV